jgi:hypothetical protein
MWLGKGELHGKQCARCKLDVKQKHGIWCCECGKGFHYWCFCLPYGYFPTQLKEGESEKLRIGDTRRPDFQCPTCQFKHIMQREPLKGRWQDAWLLILEVQMTLDEYHKDSASYSQNCMYVLNKMKRWGDEFEVPTMLARNKEELRTMHSDHRQLGWYAVDQTRTVKWGTAKKHRSAAFNYYERMPGLKAEDIPTSTTRFTHRMNGLLQRKGNESKQDKVFTELLLEDMVKQLSSQYDRARGERKVELAQVNLAFHMYTQAGLRANEAFEMTVGQLKGSFCFGEEAARQKIRPHFKITCKKQTKENRFSGTEVLCSYEAKRAPLASGHWAEVVVMELERVQRAHKDNRVFATVQGKEWTMGWLWYEYIDPALQALKEEQLGGLEKADLDAYGTNSFRRTWNTLAGQHPNPVSKDLRERQARWRHAKRQSEEMASLYFDPRPQELLIATYWL